MSSTICSSLKKVSVRRPLLTIYIFMLTFVVFKCGRHLRNNIKSLMPSNEVTDRDEHSLKELVDKNGNIIGDISWLLDFAVIGFPKSGTSFMKDYLNQTQETFVYHKEFCIKKESDLKRFVEIYHDLHVRFQQPTHNKTMRFGLKCPGVLYRAYDMEIFEKYFPTTKLIVGLRHPVSWFESFYNYQMVRNVSMPSLTSLVGKCESHQKVCTDRARFHSALARLKKTLMSEKEELDLLFGNRYEGKYNSLHKQRLLNEPEESPNKLLLYELRQIHNNDTAREVSSSLRNYLGIKQELPLILPFKQVKPRAINICDDEHVNVRSLLVEHGTDAAVWMRRYLFKNPTVQIASPESFDRLLDSWSVDPCAHEN